MIAFFTMRVRYVIVLLAIVCGLGYIIGQLVPWNYLHPKLINKEISANDYYTRLISLVGAAATIFATMVALFKEDIKKLYENASLQVAFKNDDKVSEILDSESEGDSSSSSLIAKKFEVQLCVHNKGKLAAKGCQIYLEKFSFTPHGSPGAKEIQPSGKPLQWVGKNELAVVVPSKAKTYVTVIEILSPQSAIVASNDGSGQATSQSGQHPPQIRIAGVEFPPLALHGAYKCSLMVYSENAAPVEFVMDMHWNGKWCQRLTEMKEGITLSSKISK